MKSILTWIFYIAVGSLLCCAPGMPSFPPNTITVSVNPLMGAINGDTVFAITGETIALPCIIIKVGYRFDHWVVDTGIAYFNNENDLCAKASVPIQRGSVRIHAIFQECGLFDLTGLDTIELASAKCPGDSMFRFRIRPEIVKSMNAILSIKRSTSDCTIPILYYSTDATMQNPGVPFLQIDTIAVSPETSYYFGINVLKLLCASPLLISLRYFNPVALCTLSLVADEHCLRIVPEKAIVFAHDTSVSISAQIAKGYRLKQWQVTKGFAHIANEYSPTTDVALSKGDSSIWLTALSEPSALCILKHVPTIFDFFRNNYECCPDSGIRFVYQAIAPESVSVQLLPANALGPVMFFSDSSFTMAFPIATTGFMLNANASLYVRVFPPKGTTNELKPITAYIKSACTEQREIGLYSETAPGFASNDSFSTTYKGKSGQHDLGSATIQKTEQMQAPENENALTFSVSLSISDNEYAGWYIQWGKDGTPDTMDIDLEDYKNGIISFYVKSNIDLIVGIRSSDVSPGQERSKIQLSQIGSFKSDNQWHHICIPLSVFAVLSSSPTEQGKANLQKMKVLFNISPAFPNGAIGVQTGVFRLDDIRWEKKCGFDYPCDVP